MFDITSSKLFLLAIVALLVIGPKDFPVLLRTIGKYVGILRGHAREFRAQFDEAMRESELTEIKKDMESLAQETEGVARETQASLSTTGQSVRKTFDEFRQDVESSVKAPTPAPAGQQTAPAQPGENGAAAQPGTEPGTETRTEPGTGQTEEAVQASSEPPPVAPEPAETGSPASAPAPAVERTGA